MNNNNERLFMRLQLAEIAKWAGANKVPESKMTKATMIWINHNAADFCKQHHPDTPEIKGLLMSPAYYSIW